MSTNAEILSQVPVKSHLFDEEAFMKKCADRVKDRDISQVTNEVTNNTLSEIDKMPARIRHYLLDWKHTNLETYIERYGDVKLSSFSKEQIKVLFDNATMSDLQLFS